MTFCLEYGLYPTNQSNSNLYVEPRTATGMNQYLLAMPGLVRQGLRQGSFGCSNQKPSGAKNDTNEGS